MPESLPTDATGTTHAATIAKPARLFTRGLSGLWQSSDPNCLIASSVSSAAEQRDNARRNFPKAMRPLPTQHYVNVCFDRTPSKEQQRQRAGLEYRAQLEQLGPQIEIVKDFWRYNYITPVDQIKMRERISLFSSGFRPLWEDRRKLLAGSRTFRLPKAIGQNVWTRLQLRAIGEKLQSVLEEVDQIWGVALPVRFHSHLISIWNRDASRPSSIDAMLQCLLKDVPAEFRPKPTNYFYRKHSAHAGFKIPPGLQAVGDSQSAREGSAKRAKEHGAQGRGPEALEVRPSRGQ
ncbi:hypothetical protein NEMBOFW57_005201 [Staphylotrichum longicolle]|uniref:Uncharacterized protein n=1 Tax=Staphylotrichum longicolle TaxID=669026 RepID=A0AAD4HYA2_9PEZI|nr:hypothetical protein NEMBOFW57_005201 [Staphylotrichum longicolle]